MANIIVHISTYVYFLLGITYLAEGYIIVTDFNIANHTEDGNMSKLVKTAPGIYGLMEMYRSINDSDYVSFYMDSHLSFNTLKTFVLGDNKHIYPDNIEVPEYIYPENIQVLKHILSENINAPSEQSLKHYHYYIKKIDKLTKIQSLHPRDTRDIGLIANNNCSDGQLGLLRRHIEEVYGVAPCYKLSAKISDIRFALVNLKEMKVSHILMLLPFNLLMLILPKVFMYGLREVTFVTFNLYSSAYQQIRTSYPHLDIYNIRPREMNDFYDRNENRLIISPKYDILSDAEKIYNDLPSLFQFDASPMQESSLVTDQFEKRRKEKTVINVASLFFEVYVKNAPDQLTSLSHCITGKLCKIPQFRNKKTIWQTSCCVGLLIDIFDLLIKDMGVDYIMYIVEDGLFGAHNNGKWNGIINDVLTKRADVGVQILTPTIERQKVVDFTDKIFPKLTVVGLVTKKEPSDMPIINWAFLKSLHTHLLLAVLATTAVIIVIVFSVEYIGYKMKMYGRHSSLETFTYVTGILFQRDLGGVNPPHWPARLVSILYAFAMTMFISSYTAQLTAGNIDNKPTYTFEGFRDKKFQDPSFKIGFVANTSTELIFRGLQRKYNWTKGYGTKDEAEGISRVHSGSLDVFYGEVPIMEDVIKHEIKYCTALYVHAAADYTTEWAFAVSKGSYLRNKLSYSLRKLKEHKLIDYIDKKWSVPSVCDNEAMQYQRFPWQYFGGWLVLLGGTTLFSLLLLFAETLWERFKSKTSEKYDLNRNSVDVRRIQQYVAS